MIDYKDIEKSRDKLVAVCSLLEQMRLEHNKQGDIVRNNMKLYEDGTWAEYQRQYRDKQRPLLLEMVALRRMVRQEEVDDEAWPYLGYEVQEEIMNSIHEAKIEGKQIITEATATELDDVKLLNVVDIQVIK